MREFKQLIEPIIETIEIKAKTIVFCDEGEEDWNNYFKNEFDYAGIIFNNLTIFDSPEAFKESFSIFMFDWGGMSLGNSCLRSFTRQLYKLAEENPNKDFVLLSYFTQDAYNDMNKDISTAQSSSQLVAILYNIGVLYYNGKKVNL